MEHFLKDVEKITLDDITSVARRVLSSPLTMASYGDGNYFSTQPPDTHLTSLTIGALGMRHL